MSRAYSETSSTQNLKSGVDWFWRPPSFVSKGYRGLLPRRLNSCISCRDYKSVESYLHYSYVFVTWCLGKGTLLSFKCSTINIWKGTGRNGVFALCFSNKHSKTRNVHQAIIERSALHVSFVGSEQCVNFLVSYHICSVTMPMNKFCFVKDSQEGTKGII
jgi:hypothetical protein